MSTELVPWDERPWNTTELVPPQLTGQQAPWAMGAVTSTSDYKRPDHDRIWIQDTKFGPVLEFSKRYGKDHRIFATDNDLKLLIRAACRYLAKDYTIVLVPLEDVQEEEDS